VTLKNRILGGKPALIPLPLPKISLGLLWNWIRSYAAKRLPCLA